jgi:hypothetical protein
VDEWLAAAHPFLQQPSGELLPRPAQQYSIYSCRYVAYDVPLTALHGTSHRNGSFSSKYATIHFGSHSCVVCTVARPRSKHSTANDESTSKAAWLARSPLWSSCLASRIALRASSFAALDFDACQPLAHQLCPHLLPCHLFRQYGHLLQPRTLSAAPIVQDNNENRGMIYVFFVFGLRFSSERVAEGSSTMGEGSLPLFSAVGCTV